MILKIAYNDDSKQLVKKLEEIISTYPLVTIESYHENIFKERKKAFKLKSAYSARKSPFSLLVDSENKVVKVFYSESNDCTFENIINTLNSLTTYNDLQGNNQ